ncbi:DinB family protein [Spirosoma rhododendri]|uniref:DinB family protein n=1 Tax=Spirosoma rhododendri TaxID=2728024 RepID=A0A7L5DNS5_9BACT|nr:hypothetical protein [Spirosoma rhododendri]QJD79212.1 DinB family protein [Spirosoma rhododendri]
MNSKIRKIKNLRLFLLEQIAGLSTKQLNAVRVMSNNNIIWNIAHLIAAQ